MIFFRVKSVLRPIVRYSSSNFVAEFGLVKPPNRTFLYLENGTEVSYADLLDRVQKTASCLRNEHNVAIGDRILARVSKKEESIYLYLACLYVGAIYVPLNPQYTAHETKHFVQDAEPKLIVTCDHEKDLRFKSDQICVKDETIFASEVSTITNSVDMVNSDAGMPACICYTSGTTGKPKGAVISHRSLINNAKALVNAWHFTENDILLHMLPFYHVHGMFLSLNCSLLSHSSLLWRKSFKSDACIDDLKQSTVMMGVPTYYSRLLENPKFTKDIINSKFRLFVSGSAPLSLATWNDFYERTGHKILERYGMTEALVICSNEYDPDLRKSGYVGKPLIGTSVKVNEKHEIQIKSDSLFCGYWKNPAKTEEAFTNDNYFITGDTGEFDSQGNLHIYGRSKDMIISGGLNVFPKEIEDVIDSIPQINESAVIGVPDDDFGEAVVAVVALNKDSMISEKDLISKIKEKCAGYKVPKRVIFVSELPRNAMAKVQKNVLRDKYKYLRKH